MSIARIAETVSLFRGAERLIIVGGAILALYLGYRLFVAGVVNKQSGEFSGKSFSIKLINVGPGVFFALFGTGVLVFMISTNIKMELSDIDRNGDGQANISFFIGQDESRIERVIEEISAVKSMLLDDKVSRSSVADVLTSSQKKLAQVVLGEKIYDKCEFGSEEDRDNDCVIYDQLIR